MGDVKNTKGHKVRAHADQQGGKKLFAASVAERRAAPESVQLHPCEPKGAAVAAATVPPHHLAHFFTAPER
jgi:hypothetical protein